MKTKVCTKCGTEKPVSEFSKDRSKADGLCSKCKSCVAAYYEANKEKIAAYYEANKEKKAAYDAARNAIVQGRARALITHARLRARNKGVDFDLDSHREEIEARIAKGVCERTGYTFEMDSTKRGQRNRHPRGPSFDRIDQRKGYTYDNLQIVCWQYNAAKAEIPDAIFVNFCRGVIREADKRAAQEVQTS